MSVKMKFCGLTRPEDIRAAATAGAAYIGFNFFPKSPRYVTPAEAAALAPLAGDMVKVALVVNPDDALLDELTSTVPLDMIQLHGSESVERVAEAKVRTGLPVMKVLGVAGAEDVARIAEYEAVADQILVDAKPPKNAVLPGGNGVTFDWRLLDGRAWSKPWMLAGGLTSANVAEAVRLTGADQVDLASGIESAPGVKDAGLMEAFAAALR
ncbi:MAG: phosphoribosylanthranilate isomerase [Rhodobacteraceae bacterium]|nr:phosphoribosylanthranilate isomerase [Paracoccaceae bacterium]